jgi:hypothetical protein
MRDKTTGCLKKSCGENRQQTQLHQTLPVSQITVLLTDTEYCKKNFFTKIFIFYPKIHDKYQ